MSDKNSNCVSAIIWLQAILLLVTGRLLPLYHSSRKLSLAHGAGDADLTLSDYQVPNKLFQILNSGDLK